MPKTAPNTSRRSFTLGSPTALIRLSSLLFVFLALGHMSAYPWASTHAAQATKLIAAMKIIDFEFMGEHSTYWNLYYGWGLLVGLLLITLAAILWLLSDLVLLAPKRLGIITGLFSAVSAVGAYLSFRYFYVPPLVSFVAICLILLSVAVRLLRDPIRLAADEAANS
jgi:hypothetical protein